jgi:hypothetical protein
MTEEQLAEAIPADILRMTEKLPIVFDWCEYKGEIVVAQFNYERSVKARKPMFDLSYCMTRALNQVILKTVQWDKNKFGPSVLGGWLEHKLDNKK